MPCNLFNKFPELAANLGTQRFEACSPPFGFVGHGPDVGCGPVPCDLYRHICGLYEVPVNSEFLLDKGYDIVRELGFEGVDGCNGFDGDSFVCCSLDSIGEGGDGFIILFGSDWRGGGGVAMGKDEIIEEANFSQWTALNFLKE